MVDEETIGVDYVTVLEVMLLLLEILHIFSGT